LGRNHALSHPGGIHLVFADLRGYGDSRHLTGDYTPEEAAGDVIALADRLGWQTFSLIGHSMSGLVVQRIPQLAGGRVSRVVAVTPVAPSGMGLGRATVEMFQAIALADDQARLAPPRLHVGRSLINLLGQVQIEALAGDCGAPRRGRVRRDLGPRRHFRGRPRNPDADADYRGRDTPPFQAEALNTSMLPFYPNARLVSLCECGHYPMQEQPPLLATLIERFLSE
jgi:pimeloyl-ACP methyl ester carboxylesterase